MRPHIVLPFAASFVLTACGEMNLAGETVPVDQVAVIRPAVGPEREQGRSTDLSVTGASATIKFVKEPDGKVRSLSEHFALRVNPGTHGVVIACGLGSSNFWLEFPTEIQARAGKTYLVECIGRHRSEIRIKVREFDSSAVASVQEILKAGEDRQRAWQEKRGK